jgi:hypothetical protein
MPTKAPKKKASRSRTPAATPAPPALAPVPLTPVTRKIGEGPGNLKGRADAFTSRRGKTK